MPLSKMPNSVKSGLKRVGKKKTKDWFHVYEKAKKEYGDKSKAAATAWSAVNKEEKLSLLAVLEALEKKKEK